MDCAVKTSPLNRCRGVVITGWHLDVSSLKVLFQYRSSYHEPVVTNDNSKPEVLSKIAQGTAALKRKSDTCNIQLSVGI